MSASLLNKLAKLQEKALQESKGVKSPEQLEEFKNKYLSRKSDLNEILSNLKDLNDKGKREVGKAGNEVKQKITAELERLNKSIVEAEYEQQLRKETLDVTGAVSNYQEGHLHPITKERIIIEDIFTSMGFTVHEPMIIDDEYHNFTSLNIPQNHPAKDMWDTIWTEDNQYLIPHTSSMQNRIITGKNPPIRAIVPGRCFRNEATDRTHEHSFFQVEGVYVDKGIKLSDMFGILKAFLDRYYGTDVEIKIQPTFFPFVEPGIEIMMNYSFFMKKIGQESSELADKWIEVIPCGPIHPAVLQEAGLDPEVYSGFAWGFGLDRTVMLKYGIDDVRYFHSGKLDFTKQIN